MSEHCLIYSTSFFSFGKEPKAYLKTNLATFMECQDALVTMHNKLTWDENQKILCLDKLNMLLQGILSTTTSARVCGW